MTWILRKTTGVAWRYSGRRGVMQVAKTLGYGLVEVTAEDLARAAALPETDEQRQARQLAAALEFALDRSGFRDRFVQWAAPPVDDKGVLHGIALLQAAREGGDLSQPSAQVPPIDEVTRTEGLP